MWRRWDTMTPIRQKRFYAHLLEEGVRLDKAETLRALYDAYRGCATLVLP